MFQLFRKPTTTPDLLGELKSLHQWVLWTDEKNKRPFQPNGSMASVRNPDHWSSYERAKHFADRYGYAGVGFVFTKNDPYFGIDLDNCFDFDGRVCSAHFYFVTSMFETYMEISPSGRGCHLIGRGEWPGTKGVRKNGLEVYAQGRYFTVTEKPIKKLPIVGCQTALINLHEALQR
jgi:putative DNA primase/helicase